MGIKILRSKRKAEFFEVVGEDRTISLDPKQWVITAEIRLRIEAELWRLTKQQRRAVSLIWGLGGEKPHTRREAATTMNVTHQCVGRHLERGMRRLRKFIKQHPFSLG